MSKKIQASITIHFDSESDRAIAISSLKPETESMREDRVEVKVLDDDQNRIILEVIATDLTAFRAVINSYSRWLKIIEDSLGSIKKNLKKK